MYQFILPSGQSERISIPPTKSPKSPSRWIIKIMSTTVFETGADYLAVNADWGQGMTRAAMGALLAAALFTQLRTRRYTP